jgi:hypothetical protein
VLDSSTKFPEGVLLGTLTHMGDFEECLEVNVKEEWGSFRGQHCMVDSNVDILVYKNEVRRFSVRIFKFKFQSILPSSFRVNEKTN